MRIVLGDITKMDTDAIVNTAVSDLSPCPGICSAIFAAADTEELKKGLPEDWAMPNRPRYGHALLRTSVQNHYPCGWRWLVWRRPAGANAPGGMLPPGVAESSALQLQDCGSSTDLLRRLPYASGRVYPHRGKSYPGV